MSDSERLVELGAFLRSRREELSPETLNLTSRGSERRRTRGLRREEVAELSSISSDYYARIEQGRRPVSSGVLNSICQALRLSDDERIHVFDLAGKDASLLHPHHGTKIHHSMENLLSSLSGIPGIVVGPALEVLGWNSLASALLGDFSIYPPRQRNYAWTLFTDPKMRELYLDWEDSAEMAVAHLRMEAGKYPSNTEIARIADELCQRDSLFRRLWEARHVAKRSGGMKRLQHPVVGRMDLEWNALTLAASPDQQLIVWMPEPSSPSADALKILASWQAMNGAGSPAI